MKIIAIGHQKRVGKDTFAKMLQKQLGEQNCIILSIAQPLKEIVADALGISLATLEDWKNEEIKLKYKDYSISVRDILINFGNGKMKEIFTKQVWIKQVVRRADASTAKYIIIPDFRFKEEFDFLTTFFYSVVTIKVVRGDVLPTNKADKNLQHFSFDFVVDNNGGLKDLEQKAKELSKKCRKDS